MRIFNILINSKSLGKFKENLNKVEREVLLTLKVNYSNSSENNIMCNVTIDTNILSEDVEYILEYIYVTLIDHIDIIKCV